MIVLITTLLFCFQLAQSNENPVLSASFTWYNGCDTDHLPACGKDYMTEPGSNTGLAAANTVTYTQGSQPINGVGQGCGKCWHLTPESDPYPANGNHFGTSVVVKISDECTDGGYCDQKQASPGKVKGNTKYGKQAHFDLCVPSGVATQFFGNIDHFGNILGTAQLLDDCSALHDGAFGSAMGDLSNGTSSSYPAEPKPATHAQSPAETSPKPKPKPALAHPHASSKALPAGGYQKAPASSSNHVESPASTENTPPGDEDEDEDCEL